MKRNIKSGYVHRRFSNRAFASGIILICATLFVLSGSCIVINQQNKTENKNADSNWETKEVGPVPSDVSSPQSEVGDNEVKNDFQKNAEAIAEAVQNEIAKFDVEEAGEEQQQEDLSACIDWAQDWQNYDFPYCNVCESKQMPGMYIEICATAKEIPAYVPCWKAFDGRGVNLVLRSRLITGPDWEPKEILYNYAMVTTQMLDGSGNCLFPLLPVIDFSCPQKALFSAGAVVAQEVNLSLTHSDSLPPFPECVESAKDVSIECTSYNSQANGHFVNLAPGVYHFAAVWCPRTFGCDMHNVCGPFTGNVAESCGLPEDFGWLYDEESCQLEVVVVDNKRRQ